MFDLLALAIALAFLAYATVPLARITAPRGIGRERHQRVFFWLVTFPIYLATLAALALAALHGALSLLLG